MRVAAAALTGVLLLVSGCSSSRDCPASSVRLAASCAAAVEYQQTLYVAWSDQLPAVRGDRLGDAVFPGCNDTGCAASAPDTPTVVWALRGVDPAVAVVGRREGTHQLVVYGLPQGNPKAVFRLDKEGRWHLR